MNAIQVIVTGLRQRETIQGVIDREAQGRFEIKSTITPRIV